MPLFSSRSDDVPALARAGDAKRLSQMVSGLSGLGKGGRDVKEQLARCEAEPLANALRDPDKKVREAAAEVLGHMTDPRAVEALIGALGDEHPSVRWRAARSLGRRGDRRAVPPLIDALDDEKSDVRQKAAGALGALGDPRAVPELVAALGDKNGMVSTTAKLSLQQLRATGAVLRTESGMESSEPAAETEVGTWAPVNPQFASNRPLSTLEHVFIFTSWERDRWLNSPASPVLWGMLQDTAGAPRAEIVGKVKMDIVANSDAGPEATRTGQVPDAVRLSVSSMRPELADHYLCTRGYEDPSTGEEGLIVLVYGDA